jgi:voltage-gated potassium channel
MPLAARVRRALLLVVAVIVVYYAVPLGETPSTAGIVLSVIGLLLGLGVLVWITLRQVARLAAAGVHDESVRIETLVFVVFVVVPTFAAGYYAIEQADPDQFADLATRTDALYFTVSTLATVGFGDVHATGQLARALVTVQIVFNLLFVATLVSLLSRVMRERGAARRAITERGRTTDVDPGARHADPGQHPSA